MENCIKRGMKQSQVAPIPSLGLPFSPKISVWGPSGSSMNSLLLDYYGDFITLTY